MKVGVTRIDALALLWMIKATKIVAAVGAGFD
jgi:hypothetical protein